MYRKPYTIYNNDLWWSDARDALDYGVDFDFSKTFTEQFAALVLAVPKYATHNLNSENSQYTNMTANSKNCYLMSGCINNEDCAYGHIVWYSEDLYDCAYTKTSQDSFQCVDCFHINKVAYANDSQYCAECFFLYRCAGCTNCFGCVGLSNRQYCIFNKQHTKEEYDAYIASLNLADPAVIKNIQSQMDPLLHKMLRPMDDITESERAVGDYLIQSKDVLGFDIVESEKVRYGYTIGKFIDSQDVCFS